MAIELCFGLIYTVLFTGRLTRCTLPLIGSTGKLIGQEVLRVIYEYESKVSVNAIFADNDSFCVGYQRGLSTTLIRRGFVTQLEDLMCRELHTIECSLHQNKLPFKALLKNLDGITSGPAKFCGPLGKLCSGTRQITHQTQQDSRAGAQGESR